MLELLGIASGALAGGLVSYGTYRTLMKIKIHSKQSIRRMLKKYGLKTKFENGEIRCAICGDVVDYENVGIIEISHKTKKISFITESCVTQSSSLPLSEIVDQNNNALPLVRA